MIPTHKFYVYRTSGAFDIEKRLIPWKHLEPQVKALLTDAQLDLERVGFDAEDQFGEEEWAEIESTLEDARDAEGTYDDSAVDDLEFAMVFRGEAVVGFLFTTEAGQSYVTSFLPLPELADFAVGLPQEKDGIWSMLRRRR